MSEPINIPINSEQWADVVAAQDELWAAAQPVVESLLRDFEAVNAEEYPPETAEE